MNDQCKDCPYIAALKETQIVLDKRLTLAEESIKLMGKDVSRIDKDSAVLAEQLASVYNILTEIKASIAEVNITLKLSNQMAEANSKILKDEQSNKFEKIKEDIDAIKASPAKRWEKIGWIFLSAVIVALVSGIATGKIRIIF